MPARPSSFQAFHSYLSLKIRWLVRCWLSPAVLATTNEPHTEPGEADCKFSDKHSRDLKLAKDSAPCLGQMFFCSFELLEDPMPFQADIHTKVVARELTVVIHEQA